MPNLTPEQLAALQPDHPIFAIMERMEKIQDTMTRNDPELATHLKVVHKTLGQYEDLPHILTPEEIGVLMNGFKKHAGMVLIAEKPRGSKSKKDKIGLDDI